MTGPKVGYKSPPRATRWKKGQSGNPRGRPKGSLNLKGELSAELGEFIQVREAGAPKRITKQRALLKALVAKGIGGDARAASVLIGLMVRLLDHDTSRADEVDISPDDNAILEAFLQQRCSEPESPS